MKDEEEEEEVGFSIKKFYVHFIVTVICGANFLM